MHPQCKNTSLLHHINDLENQLNSIWGDVTTLEAKIIDLKVLIKTIKKDIEK